MVERVDLMGGESRIEATMHEHGFVALVDVMPRLVPEGQTGDSAIVQAARVSYGEGTKARSDDRALIRYLMRHDHGTPFEMVEFKFHMAMPIFVARQFIRHRTANVNEYSARYSVLPDKFFRPEIVRRQSQANRQGGYGSGDEEMTAHFHEYLDFSESLAKDYKKLLAAGVDRGLARIGLPLSQYTQWYWKCDLRNILNFLRLRLSLHAQDEIRDYASAMLGLIEPIVPLTIEAFRDYQLDALRLSRLEIEALATGREEFSNKREREEWLEKKRKLGLED